MRFLILLIALLFWGCGQLNAIKDLAGSVTELISGKDNAEPPKELDSDFEPKVTMTVLWKASVGKGYNGRVLNLVPAVTASTVYIADHRGLIEAYGRQDGERLWSADTRLEFSAGPTVVGDRLLFGTSNAELIAVSLTDGALLWKTSVTSEVLALPKVVHNTVIVRTSDGRIAGLDLTTGKFKWSHERSVPPLSVRSLGSPAISGDLVLDGFGGGKMVALSSGDGRVAWETTAAVPKGRSEVERMVELDGEPLLQDGIVYATGFQGGVSAINAEDGEVIWHQNTAYSSHGMAISRHGLFITDTHSDLWQLDLRGGADLWKQTELHQRHLTVPALIHNRVVVGDFEGYVHALSADDGSLIGRLSLDDEPIIATPVVHDDTLFVYSSSGLLAAITLN